MVRKRKRKTVAAESPIVRFKVRYRGAILPKIMGKVGDVYDISRGFIVPMFCFVFIAYYAFNWPKYSKAKSLNESTGPLHCR